MCTPNTTISKLQTPTPQSGILRETEKPNSKTLDNRRKKTKPKQILAAPRTLVAAKNQKKQHRPQPQITNQNNNTNANNNPKD
jgi:hypothetical protein